MDASQSELALPAVCPPTFMRTTSAYVAASLDSLSELLYPIIDTHPSPEVRLRTFAGRRLPPDSHAWGPHTRSSVQGGTQRNEGCSETLNRRRVTKRTEIEQKERIGDQTLSRLSMQPLDPRAIEPSIFWSHAKNVLHRKSIPKK